jgi:hypothetical protein
MTNENFVLDGYTFTNECMAGNFYLFANLCPLLNFDKGTNLASISDLTAIQIDKSVDLHVFSQLDVWSDTCKFCVYHWITS